MNSCYVGRFAPSPTGPLHLGSLLAALASYLDARANGGIWLLRIDDIDPPREQIGASEAIIDGLKRYDMDWDGDALMQSSRRPAHDGAISRLLGAGTAFYCSCSRNDLNAYAGVYPGTCRQRGVISRRDASIRLRVDDPDTVEFEDRIQGKTQFDRTDMGGDFVIMRRDRLIAYQLACAVDDAWQGVTHVVRGCDLLGSTARQLHVMRELGLRVPCYAHIPVIVGASGAKLSKQNHAEALNPEKAEDTLIACLRLLGQAPPPSDSNKHCRDILLWATANWAPDRIPRGHSLPIPSI